MKVESHHQLLLIDGALRLSDRVQGFFPILTVSFCLCFLLQKYRHHDEDSSPQDQSSPQLTEEAGGAELVQVAEKNLSQIQNVHGYVTHAHISPMKVGETCASPSNLCLLHSPLSAGMTVDLKQLRH